MGNQAEVLVAREEGRRVAQGQCGDPEIIRGNRRTLRPQLSEHRGILGDCRFVRPERRNPGLSQEVVKSPLVFDLAGSQGKAGPKFREHHEGHEKFSGRLDQTAHVGVATGKIDVAIGVENDPQGDQSSASMPR